MHIEQRVARGLMSVLCLGILLGASILPLQAGDRAAQFISGKNVPSGGVQPGVPQAGRLTLRAASVHRSGHPHQRTAVRKAVYRPQLPHIRAPAGTYRWRPAGRPWLCAPHLVSWGMG